MKYLRLLFVLFSLIAPASKAADAPKDPELKTQHFCASCGKTSGMICSGCKNVHYCSRECQVSHRNAHKIDCSRQSILMYFKELGYKQQLRDFLVTPAKFSSHDLDRVLTNILIPSTIFIPALECAPFEEINKELRSVAKKHGFTCRTAELVSYPRDVQARLGKTALKCTTTPVHPEKVGRSFELLYHYYRQANNLLLKKRISTVMTNFLEEPKKYWDFYHSSPREMDKNTVGIYDGGDMMVLNNTQGKAITLMGEGTVFLNLAMLQKASFFENAEIKQIVDEYRIEFATKALNKNRDQVFEVATFIPKNYTQDDIATLYAQRKYVQEQLIPKDLGLKADEIVYISQLAYHLDLFIAPAPSGQVIVMDLKKSEALLEKMLKAKKSDALSAALRNALEHTKKDADALNHITESVVTELTEAGFDVIRAPSAFIAGKEATSFINFLNPIYGRKGCAEKTGESKQSEEEGAKASNPSKSYFWYTLDPYPGTNQVLIEELKKVWAVFLKDLAFFGHDLEMGFLKGGSLYTAESGAGAHCLYTELD